MAPEFRKAESRQAYGKKTPIAGVRVLDLKRFVDDGGDLRQLGRVVAGLSGRGVVLRRNASNVKGTRLVIGDKSEVDL